MITTGHRLVKDIFDNRNFFFIEDNFCFIGDKAASKESVLRIVPLCSKALQQISLYKKHVDSIAFRINKFDQTLAKKIALTSSINENHFCPFLFEINNDGELQGINKNNLKDWWGADFVLPDNFYRHMLSTFLFKQNLDREYINYLLGHIAAGQNPLSQTSPLKTAVWFAPILDKLELYSEALGITCLKGLKRGKGHQKIEFCTVEFKAKSYGCLERHKTRQNKQNQIKSIVFNYLTSNFPNILDRGYYKPLLNDDFDQIKAFLESLPKRDKSKGFEITQKYISRYYRKFNKKQPVIWFIEKHDLSGSLPLSTPLYLQQAKTFSHRLEEMIKNRFTSKSCNFTEKVALSYIFSLTDNLSSKVLIKDYLALLKSTLYINEKTAHFNYVVNDIGMKWYPNTLQLLLIKGLKDNWPSNSPTVRNLSNSINNILQQISVECNLEIFTLNDLKKLFRYSFIFNSSAAEYNQKELISLFSFFEKKEAKNLNLNVKEKVTTTRTLRSQDSSNNNKEAISLNDELKSLNSSLRTKKRLLVREELKGILNKYLNSNSEFAYVLSSWGLDMLANGTRKTISPAPSTILTYLIVNTSTFINILSDQCLLQMNDFEISCLFDEVLEINGVNKHTLSSLLNFSDFLAAAANKSNIIIDSNMWSVESVDINYFSDHEIETLREHEWESEERIFIELLIQSGGRCSEVYALIYDDIDIIGNSVQLRTNRLSRLKNRFSIRPISFDFISLEVINKLKTLKEAHKKTQPIFDWSYTEEKQKNYKSYCFSVNKKIQNILKRKVNIKHFRHTFASSNFRKNKKSSLRSIWQDAATLGHSSPFTSQKHYIHDVFNENRIHPIDDFFLSEITGLKQATIRKKRSRLYKDCKSDINLLNTQVLLESLI